MKRLALLLTPALLFACADASEDGSASDPMGSGKADDLGVCCELDDLDGMEADTMCCADGLWSAQCKAGTGEVCEDDGAPFDPSARGQVDDACGSLINPLCADGLFCRFPPEANCGRTDHGGSCAVQPDTCLEVFSPVCGCDGTTFGNACEADAAGVSHIPGSCEADGAGEFEICRPGAGIVCGAGLLCDLSVADTCEDENAVGLCIAIPQSCEDEDAPVCGCDGVTYGNACEAHAAAQVVASEGPC